MQNTLVGEFVSELLKPVNGVGDVISCNSLTNPNGPKNFEFQQKVSKYIQQTNSSTKLRQQLPDWQFDYVKVRRTLISHTV